MTAQLPPQAVQLFLNEDESYSVTVVDTPGFDDTYRSDAEILAEITEYMAAQYAAKIPLKGIIYLHQIHENKMKGSGRRVVEMFRALCGDEALKKVVLVTTRWDCVSAAEKGNALRREQELIDTWWRPMLDLGSTHTQFHGSRLEAEAMVLEIIRDPDRVVLDIQRELVDAEKEIAETKAGLPLDRLLAADISRYIEQLREIDAKLADAERRGNSNDVKRLKEERKEIEGVVRKLESSQKRIRVRVGRHIKERISAARWDSKEILATSISIFTAIVGVTLTVVKFAVL